ncbi:MAG: hypothetical protein COA88_14220 [Kordia sp.]|nr:MAG: hypothetical protein COA88_14220 [Kordia sp.]
MSLKKFRPYLYFLTIHLAIQTQAQVKFEKLNDTDKLVFYNALTDSLKTIDHFLYEEEFQKIVKPRKFNENQKRIQLVVAETNRFSGNHIKSINTLNRILESEQYQLTITDSITILNDLKKSYYSLYLYPEIFEVNTKIKKLIQQGAQYPLWTYNMNSRLYAQLKLYDKAAMTLEIELEELIITDNNKQLIMASGLNDLGYYFFKANNYDYALLNFNKSLRYAEQTIKENNLGYYKNVKALVKGNIAEVYICRKQYIEAIPLLLEDIEVGIENKGGINSMVNSYNLLVLCYIQTKAYNEAVKVIKEMTPVVERLTDKTAAVAYLKNKATLFYKMNEKDSAHYYLNKTIKLKDSIGINSLNKILASNELIYTRAEERKLEKQHQIDLKNQELGLKNRQKDILILFTILLLLLLVLSLYYSYKLTKSRKEVREKNKQITLKNEQVKIALSEKEVLLKEVHHRVKNNLQVISGLLELQNISVTDESVKLALKEGQNRIQSVALVHKMMYQSENVSKVNMQKYLEELLQVLQISYGHSQKNITTYIDAKGIDFDVTLAVPISLIVNEAVCNAYKHAFENKNTGKIWVIITKELDEAYSLLIKDNGVGVPENFDIKKLKSIGFDLIRGLSKQLKGTLEVKKDNGTMINIIFSRNK